MMGGQEGMKKTKTRTLLYTILLGALVIGVCLLGPNALGAFVKMVFDRRTLGGAGTLLIEARDGKISI